MLTLVPDGKTHRGVPLDAAEEFRLAAGQYREKKLLPWIRRRTQAFRQAVVTARVSEVHSPCHHIFIARADETA